MAPNSDSGMTTIWVSKITAVRLKRVGGELEDCHNPTYDEILRQLINYREIHLKGVDPKLLKKSGKKE